MSIVRVTGEPGRVVHAGVLARAEAVRRRLRSALPRNCAAKIARVLASRDRPALPAEHGRGRAVDRTCKNAKRDLHRYAGDRRINHAQRPRGLGRPPQAGCERTAREGACRELVLNSGTGRRRGCDARARRALAACRLGKGLA